MSQEVNRALNPAAEAGPGRKDKSPARRLRAFVLGLTKPCRHTGLPQRRPVQTAGVQGERGGWGQGGRGGQIKMEGGEQARLTSTEPHSSLGGGGRVVSKTDLEQPDPPESFITKVIPSEDQKTGKGKKRSALIC